MNAAKQLRQKILDLAIRGQLVPQSPKDEPAEKLLQRIWEERFNAEEQRSRGRGRSQSAPQGLSLSAPHGRAASTKPPRSTNSINPVNPVETFPPIPDEEKPFALPKGWVWCRLGEVFSFQAGKNISAKELASNDKSGLYPCFGGNGVRGYLPYYSNEGVHAIVGRQGALCGNVRLSADKFYATEHAVVVDTFCDMTPQFAYYFLTKLNLNQYATATAQPGLSVKEICKVPIPLPPLAEQKRIVAKVEALLKDVDKYERAVEGLTGAADDLSKKILDLAIRGQLTKRDPKDEPAEKLLARIWEGRAPSRPKGRGRTPYPPSEASCEAGAMRGAAPHSARSPRSTRLTQPPPIPDEEKPFALPKGWAWCRLGDLGEFFGGHTPSLAVPSNWERGSVLWVTSKDMKQKYISDTGIKVSKNGAAELQLLPKGTLLMVTRSGILRRTFPIAIAAKELTINQDQRALRLYFPEMSEYLYNVLKGFESLILRDYRKTGTTVESIIWEKFVDLPIPLPPLAEQKRIVAKVEKLLSDVERLKKGAA